MKVVPEGTPGAFVGYDGSGNACGFLAHGGALDKQVAGEHYRHYKIQPVEYIVANGLGFLAGNVVKYVTRYKSKGGEEDVRKAIHYLELILEFEYPKETI